MVRHVTRDKLLGQYLHRRTGTLIRSITASPEFIQTEASVTGVFGSNLDYARYHEEGFSGSLPVRAHERHIKERFETQRFQMGGSEATGRLRIARLRVLTRAARTIQVRAHTRRVNIEARHFLRDTVLEGAPETGLNARKAILLLAKTRAVPSIGAIRSAGAVSLLDLRRF